MYIRRKVFSLLNVEGEARYFSTTDYVMENDQEVRLFSDSEKKMSGKKKAAIAAGATAGTAAAVIGGGKLAGKAIRNMNKKELVKLVEEAKLTGEAQKKAVKKVDIAKALEKPADIIVEGAKGAVEGVKKGYKKAGEASKNALEKIKAVGKKEGKKAGEEAAKK